jgi:hypothetical protein
MPSLERYGCELLESSRRLGVAESAIMMRLRRDGRKARNVSRELSRLGTSGREKADERRLYRDRA